jgi:rhomboid protease GluP
MGGIVNLIVLNTMPEHATLVGVSGVVNWMGGAWLALAWLIDRRESKIRRFGKIIAVTIVLFIPDSFKPQISYLSHFLGYFIGMLSSVIFYYFFKSKFIKEEINATSIELPVEIEDAYWLNE